MWLPKAFVSREVAGLAGVGAPLCQAEEVAAAAALRFGRAGEGREVGQAGR